ncbi:hypothetical protein DPW01_02960 [Aggregatibacter aphrophilus]|uniref:hypothetical protein n=1 Tax=Aggregatibacter aphrophilus TaxID=732 RepID=UPI000DA41674|nr:hypothetical protein [Aggregatibacter aphrophilus]RDE93236.1 hypothetical protein DPW01_02960 [Aggregatibacter aphrophilus]SQI97498.1 Uncharacterised protein [Aggregatibacter aphrophilus]
MWKKIDILNVIFFVLVFFVFGVSLCFLIFPIKQIEFEFIDIISCIVSIISLFITYSAVLVAKKGIDIWKTQKARELVPKLYSSVLNIDAFFNVLDFSNIKKSINGDISFFVDINKFLGMEIVVIQKNLLDYEKFIGGNEYVEELKSALVKLRNSYISYKECVTKNSSLITKKQMDNIDSSTQISFSTEILELHIAMERLLTNLDKDLKPMVNNVRKLYDL